MENELISSQHIITYHALNMLSISHKGHISTVCSFLATTPIFRLWKKLRVFKPAYEPDNEWHLEPSAQKLVQVYDILMDRLIIKEGWNYSPAWCKIRDWESRSRSKCNFLYCQYPNEGMFGCHLAQCGNASTIILPTWRKDMAWVMCWSNGNTIK